MKHGCFWGGFADFLWIFPRMRLLRAFGRCAPPRATLGGVVTTVALRLRRAARRRASLWGRGGSWRSVAPLLPFLSHFYLVFFAVLCLLSSSVLAASRSLFSFLGVCPLFSFFCVVFEGFLRLGRAFFCCFEPQLLWLARLLRRSRGFWSVWALSAFCFLRIRG